MLQVNMECESFKIEKYIFYIYENRKYIKVNC